MGSKIGESLMETASVIGNLIDAILTLFTGVVWLMIAAVIGGVTLWFSWLLLFGGTLSASGQLGAGKCSAIAVAIHRRHILAIDDRRATIQARRADRTLGVLATRDLMVSMIGEGLLDIVEADSIKNE